MDYNTNIIVMKARLAIKMLVDDYNKTDLYKYQRLISKLIYLIYRIKSNIVFAVSQLANHNADLKKGHFQVVKRVVKYLKRSI